MKSGVITTGGDVQLKTEAFSECLKSAYHFSGYTVHNICTGAEHFIPHGFWDYVGVGLIAMLGLGMVLFLFTFLLSFLSDI